MAKKKDGKKDRKKDGKKKAARAEALPGGAPVPLPGETGELVTREDLLAFLVHVNAWVQIVHDALANPQEDGRFRVTIPHESARIVIRSSPERPC